MGGGGKTTTNTISQSAPQVVPQGLPGYQAAQDYFGNLVTNPNQAVYPGPRVAPLAPGQQASINQAYSLFGGGPTQLDQSVESYLDRSLGGGYLAGPEAQGAVAGLAQPIFQQFTSDVLPGIRDRAQFAGQGSGSDRRDVATGTAIDQLGQGVARGAVAPIYQAGLNNMTQAAQLAPTLNTTEIAQLGALSQAGGMQQEQLQRELDAVRALFTEPYGVASNAANALFSAAGTGGAGGSSSSVGSNAPGAMGTIGQIGGLGASGLASAAAISALASAKTGAAGGGLATAALPAMSALFLL